MTLIASSMLIWCAGFGANLLLLNSDFRWIRMTSAFLMGMVSLGVIAVGASVVGIHSLNVMLVAASLLLFGGALAATARNDLSLRDLGLFLALSLSTSLLFYELNISILSYDSYSLVSLGMRIGAHGELGVYTSGQLASWGVLLPIVHSLAALLDVPLMYGLQGQIAVSFALTWFAALRFITVSTTSTPIFSFVSAAGATAALFSTQFFIFQAGYIHNSLPASALLFLTVFFCVVEDPERRRLLLAIYLAALGFGLTRTETPIAALIPLFLWHAQRPIERSDVMLYWTVFALPIIAWYYFLVNAWYYFLLNSIGSGSDILTPGEILAIIGVVAGYGFALMLKRASHTLRISHERIAAMILPIFLLISAALFIAKPEHMTASLAHCVRNLVELGQWGQLWIAIAIGLVAAWLVRTASRLDMFAMVGLAMLIFIIDLAFTRIPYRSGFGDSANRMFTHVAPLLWFYVSASLIQAAGRSFGIGAGKPEAPATGG